MVSEVRNCQNCKNDFVIASEDFDFYEKIKVPSPTFCPDCRLQRRLIWMKGIEFFKRKCDLCGEEKISIYHPNAPYTVYCTKCWWSDKWDGSDYAMDYNPNIPFLEQWNDLLHKVPLLGISVDSFTGDRSPYTNHVGHSKDCYLIYYADHNEDSAYGFFLNNNKKVLDCSPIIECENCYDSGNVFKNYGVIGTYNARHNIDCAFLSNCDKCTNCFGSMNIFNKSNVFFNVELSKEEYLEKIKNIDLGSYNQYKLWKQKAEENWIKYSPRPEYFDFSVGCSGSYVFESKNCKECFEVAGSSEDSKYLMLIKAGKVRDSYDYLDWGENAERIYEGICVGGNVKDVFFTHESGYDIHDVEYSKLCLHGCEYNFGCVGLRKKNHMILNKQYKKDEYEKLRAQIIEDMNNNPYISAEGHKYKYGEFFPPEFSPHSYNDSFAHEFFPLSKNQVLEKGLKWQDIENKEYLITMQNKDIPDNIKDTDENILKEVIQCNSCVRGFRVIPMELQFLQQHNLPLPRQCPFCRIGEKIDKWVLNMKLHDRVCDNCGKHFKTCYDKERAPNIFCMDCYRKEYL